uniref:tRNA pseudouridine(38/39) synthase n=1 Tax=Petromyzon marinus TaxID=7757 RepID=A0AAJ7WKT3_PETMA|nr:tRNA pseudouridine(38/39) synthase [Petromyzon marinus]
MRLPFNRSPLLFIRSLHPFIRSLHPFNRSPHPFIRSPHPFIRSLHPFNRSPHPFIRSPHPFIRSLHPFNRSPQPFNRSPLAFNRSALPLICCAMDWTPSNVSGAGESGGGGGGDSPTTVSSSSSSPPPSTAARQKLLGLSKDELVARIEELKRKVAAMSEASRSRPPGYGGGGGDGRGGGSRGGGGGVGGGRGDGGGDGGHHGGDGGGDGGDGGHRGGGGDGRGGGVKGGKAGKGNKGREGGKAAVARRPFDFSRHNRRHVLLKLAYLGWDYHGYAAQDNTRNTVEEQLFEALDKTRLVESRQAANYHRCGRTDRGVSAIDQVVSITLRSNLAQGKGVIPTPNADVPPGATELRYAHILNKVLPRDIRVLCWAPVEAGFSARFDCSRRRYRYWFPRGRLDIVAMRAAALGLVGSHDFRNLCKMDVANGVVGFRRTVISADVRRADGEEGG